MPWLLRQVRSADPKVREETLRELFSTIVHQGTRYSATAPAVLRWAGATALARLVPEHPPEAAVQELLGWLTDPPESDPSALQANPDALPCHDDMPFGEYTLQTLVRPGPAARRRVVEALLVKLPGVSGWRAERSLWELMVVAFHGDPQAPRPRFAGLDPLQQRVVGALARMPWIWQAAPGERIPADNPLWASGLPDTQQGLQAYVSNTRPK